MSESPQPSGEGAFGAPPGAPPWSQPGPGIPTQAVPSQPYRQAQPYQQYPQAQPYRVPAYQPSSPQPAYAGYVPATTAPFPVSTFILLIVSVISLIATGIIGIPSAVIAVLAWRQSAQDPVEARSRTTTAWIVYAVNFALAVPLLIWFYVWALSNQ